MNPVFDTAKDQLLKVFLRMNALVFQVSLSASVLILVYLGVKYFTNPGDLAKNHKNLLYVLVGVMLLSLASVIPTMLLSFLKGGAPTVEDSMSAPEPAETPSPEGTQPPVAPTQSREGFCPGQIAELEASGQQIPASPPACKFTAVQIKGAGFLKGPSNQGITCSGNWICWNLAQEEKTMYSLCSFAKKESSEYGKTHEWSNCWGVVGSRFRYQKGDNLQSGEMNIAGDAIVENSIFSGINVNAQSILVRGFANMINRKIAGQSTDSVNRLKRINRFPYSVGTAFKESNASPLQTSGGTYDLSEFVVAIYQLKSNELDCTGDNEKTDAGYSYKLCTAKGDTWNRKDFAIFDIKLR